MSYRAGFVGLIGQPNAGKSTFMNLMVEQKVSIVTSKPQTTRRRILGLLSQPEGQIVFVDAPGLVRAEKGLNAFLMSEAQDVIKNSDVLVAVLSIDEHSVEKNQTIIDMVVASRKPWIGVITKIDLHGKEHRALILRDLVEKHGGKGFLISGIKKDKDLRSNILKELLLMIPENPGPLYEEDLLSPHNTRDLVCEMIREKCFEFLHDEIPYTLAVRIRDFNEENPKIIKISADIVVGKENHKVIVIGKGGENIKTIGTYARKDIEKFLDTKVFLELKVVVREGWTENSGFMKEQGYVVIGE
jgi:GTP-binding protein Era